MRIEYFAILVLIPRGLIEHKPLLHPAPRINKNHSPCMRYFRFPANKRPIYVSTGIWLISARKADFNLTFKWATSSTFQQNFIIMTARDVSNSSRINMWSKSAEISWIQARTRRLRRFFPALSRYVGYPKNTSWNLYWVITTSKSRKSM